MKKYNSKCIILILMLIVIAGVMVIYLSAKLKGGNENNYKIEIKRAAEELSENGSINLKDYPLVRAYSEFDANSEPSGGYVVKDINGKLYAFEYVKDNNNGNITLIVAVSFAVIILVVTLILIYIKSSIIEPFNKLSNLPIELSKGNLSMPLEENESKYFGKYIWGMNLLREKLEDTKNEEYELLRDRKTLILSLSHDIKTPLSAIKLYSKALSEDLYTEDEKRREAYKGISENASEIEKYVEEIISNSKEDILNFKITQSENYLSEIIDNIKKYYEEKLTITHTDFNIDTFDDCIVKCDKDRLIEVFQNLFENAIKYGDGGSINVSFSDEEDCRLVSVINSGETVSDDELMHLFESFYRGANSGSKKGSGLGLYICKRLMLLMDGDIFASKCDNGMSFTVVIRKA